MKKPRILYFQDAMCGWCYAFGPVMDEIRIENESFFDFVAVSGGMITGDKIAPISQFAEFILSSIPNVESHTGIKFGESYIQLIKEGNYLNNSVKPAIALTAFKTFMPERSVEFAHDIQYQFFYNGKNLNEKEVYLEIISDYGIEADEFLNRLNDQEIQNLTFQEFENVKKTGVSGFPCVIGETEKGLYMLAHGYAPKEEMQKIINAFKNNIENGEPELSNPE